MTYEMKEIWGHPQRARQPVGAEAETRVTQGKPRHGGRGMLAAGNASSRGGPLCAGGARPHAPLHASGSRALRPRGGAAPSPPLRASVSGSPGGWHGRAPVSLGENGPLC